MHGPLLTRKIFKDTFSRDIERAHSKIFFVKEMLTQMLIATETSGFEDVSIVFNEGIKLVQNIDDESLSERDADDYLELLSVMDWACGVYPDLILTQSSAGNALAA